MLKKLTCLILMLLIVSMLASCSPTGPDSDSSVNSLLLSVLNSESTFIAENGQSILMKELAYGFDGDTPLLAQPQEYTFVDMDGDGNDELIADITPTQTAYIVLHEADGTVYGYLIYRRALLDLKTDGSFMQSGGVGIEYYCKIEFEADAYNTVRTAVRNSTDGIYELDGAESTIDAVNAYAEEWAAKTNAEWINVS